jgi:hypothetical protein
LNAGTLPAALTDATVSDITVSVSVPNDIDAADNMLEESIGAPVGVSDSFTLFFTTGAYAVETSWTLRDDEGELVLSDAYEGPANGGGPDASMTFEYGFKANKTDLGCYSFLVLDSYGDGIGYRMTASSPIPGVSIVEEDGDVVFSYSFFDDAVFEDEFESPFAAAAETVVNIQEPIAAEMNYYPNPAPKNGVVVVELADLNTNLPISATLRNAVGQSIMTYQQQVANDQLTFTLPASAAGLLFLELKNEEASSVLRLLVE